MDILIDTNVLIHRESDDIVPEPLRELERALRKANHTIYVHPLSVKEIQQDPRDERREQAESRVETYVQLAYPPTPGESDTEFRNHIPATSDSNEQVDNMLLFATYTDTVDFLITQDREMHRKAIEIDIQDRVFTIEEGRDYFTEEPSSIRAPIAIQRTTFGELDLNDPIFASLKEEYDEFVPWAKSKDDRPAWVNYTIEDSLGAILILKSKETENIGSNPPLGRETRLKISTLKVSKEQWGSKVGELLISIAIREAINQEVDQVYLTHYEKKNDYLIDLIESYGFKHVSDKNDGEAVFLKHLVPPVNAGSEPLEIASKYYPSFYDGVRIDKFVIPIQPKYHSKLFTSYQKRQLPINEFQGKFNSEGNAIRKAYLSNSKTRKVKPGDILLFYRSEDHQEITSLGVCKEVTYGLTDPDEISRIVGKRSVFSEPEIKEISESPTTVFLFSWHFDFAEPLSYTQLKENEVLAGPPRAVQEIDEQGYRYIRKQGGIDERFARN